MMAYRCFCSFLLIFAFIIFPQAIAGPTSLVGRDAATIADDFLNAHNTARAQHGAANLIWDVTLANYAAQWATPCVFKHSGGPYGENLAAGTGTFTAQDSVNAWMSEASSYDPNNPVPSHFTQVVWKSSTSLGCAIVTCAPGTIFDASYGSSQFTVCEYSPPGNVIGEFPQNVQP